MGVLCEANQQLTDSCPVLINRCRYYGQRLTGDAGDELDVFVEQKTHRDKDVGETSFKVCLCAGRRLSAWCGKLLSHVKLLLVFKGVARLTRGTPAPLHTTMGQQHHLME
jgi:hypothetical protein